MKTLEKQSQIRETIEKKNVNQEGDQRELSLSQPTSCMTAANLGMSQHAPKGQSHVGTPKIKSMQPFINE